MKYFTKYWYELMQKQDYTLCMKAVPDKQYTDADIAAMYDKKLKAEIARDRRDYNSPPEFIPIDFDEWELDDFVNFDEERGVLVRPTSIEEVKREYEEEQRRAQEEFDARPPFDERETVENFEAMYAGGLKHGYSRFPDWVKEEVDVRLIALGYLPKSVFDRLKAESKKNKAEFDDINKTASKALKAESKKIPEEISRGFGFHDGEVLEIVERDGDIVMTVRVDGVPYEDETPYTRITFVNGEIIERDEALKLERRVIEEDGYTYAAYCSWLYEELYKTDDGYEAHMLLLENELCYLTVRCKDIKIENNVEYKM